MSFELREAVSFQLKIQNSQLKTFQADTDKGLIVGRGHEQVALGRETSAAIPRFSQGWPTAPSLVLRRRHPTPGGFAL
jgi:hypothetical protein